MTTIEMVVKAEAPMWKEYGYGIGAEDDLTLEISDNGCATDIGSEYIKTCDEADIVALAYMICEAIG